MKLRPAFSLISLLIVIAFAAILIALLLPAVLKVREVAARTQTMNNIKQVAASAQLFHDQFKKLPAAWAEYPGSQTRFTTPAGQTAAFYEFNLNVLHNPADYSFKLPQVRPGGEDDPVVNNPYTGFAMNFYLFGDPKDGVFPTRPVAEEKPYGTPLALDDIRDGTSNTLLLATCFSICGTGKDAVQVRVNERPGTAASPFLSAVNYGNVQNWQSAPRVDKCDQTLGKHAQAYSRTGIQIGFVDISCRTVLGTGMNNAPWNAALRPNDNETPQWD